MCHIQIPDQGSRLPIINPFAPRLIGVVDAEFLLPNITPPTPPAEQLVPIRKKKKKKIGFNNQETPDLFKDDIATRHTESS